MSEAAAQRGSWRTRVDASGIERKRRREEEKKLGEKKTTIAQLSSQKTFLCKLSTAQIFCIVVCTIL